MKFLEKFSSKKEENQDEDSFSLKKISFLSDLSKKDCKLFGNYLLERNFVASEYIFKENYPHAVLFIVIKGEVDIVVPQGEKEKIVSTLQPYMHFGEIGLFIESNRTASARAKTDTTLYAISKSDFKNFIDAFPSIGIKIMYNFGVSFSKTIINCNETIKKYEQNKN